MQRSCEICGEQFPVDKNSTARYCLGCRREIQRARRQAEYESITEQLHIRVRKCVTCGNAFETKSHTQKQCDTCRMIQQERIQPHRLDKPERSKRRETSQEAAARLAYEARKAGMSYGQYVAWKERGAV